MRSEIKFWEYVILSGKKIEPQPEQEAAYEIAEYFLTREKNRKEAA